MRDRRNARAPRDLQAPVRKGCSVGLDLVVRLFVVHYSRSEQDNGPVDPERVFSDDRLYRWNADVDLARRSLRDAYRMASAATSGWKIGGIG